MQDHLDTETNIEIRRAGPDRYLMTYGGTSDLVTTLLKDISIDQSLYSSSNTGYYRSAGVMNSTNTIVGSGSCFAAKETFYFRSLEHIVSALGYLKLSGIRLALDTEIWLVKANKTIKNEL